MPDLQHPPSLIQPMLDAIESPSVPLAMATRYGEGVSMSKDWPVHRRIISWGARILARPLTSVSDPMTGCFAIRKETVSHQLHSRPLSRERRASLFAPLPPRPAATRAGPRADHAPLCPLAPP